MANPQTENGFTKIANEILEALIRTSLSGQELKIALLVIRKTYGFSKKVDFISLTQMAKALACSKIRCAQVVKNLEAMKVLTVNENINGVGKSYRFNKDYSRWNRLLDAVDGGAMVANCVPKLPVSLPEMQGVPLSELQYQSYHQGSLSCRLVF